MTNAHPTRTQHDPPPLVLAVRTPYNARMGGNPQGGSRTAALLSRHVSGSKRRAAVSVALLSLGVVIVTGGLATMRLALIAVGVVAIIGGWMTAAGVEAGGQESVDR